MKGWSREGGAHRDEVEHVSGAYRVEQREV